MDTYALVWALFVAVPFVYWTCRTLVRTWYQSWRGR